MSSNKNKFWEITTTKIVSAPNKADAMILAASSRNRPQLGTVLATNTSGTRLLAAEARDAVEAFVN